MLLREVSRVTEGQHAVKPNIPYPEWELANSLRVASELDEKLAAFLRKSRGKSTYAAFSRRVGLPASTIFRLEQCQQSITLGRLQTVLERLKCSLDDIFGWALDAHERKDPWDKICSRVCGDMLSTIEGLKSDLAKLADVLNQFKSEAVQVKLLDRFFSATTSFLPSSPTTSTTAPPSDATTATTTEKPRRGRPPGAKKAAVQTNTAPTKKKKRSAMGATGALNALISKGYFKAHRTIAEIVQACDSKAGVTIKVTNLSGPLVRFVQEGKLQRGKNGDDKFEYWVK